MDRVIGLIIAASVILISSVIVISISSSGLGDFGESVDQKKSAGCDFQEKRIDESGGDPSDLTGSCKDSADGQLVLQNDPEVIDAVTGP